MTRTTVFQSNRSQAVRLPKDVAFPEGVKEVTVLREGKRRVIVPSNAVWDDFFDAPGIDLGARDQRSEEHTSELQSLMRISYAVFCLKKKQRLSKVNIDM